MPHTGRPWKIRTGGWLWGRRSIGVKFTDECSKADRDLILMAPDMYATLKSVEKLLSIYHTEGGGNVELLAVRLVLARAGGENDATSE